MHSIRNTRHLSTLVLAIMLAAMALLAASCGDSSGTTQEETQTNPAMIPQKSEAGTATVAVAPEDLSDSASVWKFNVTLDSNEGDIGVDMTQAAVLVGSDGKDIAAKGWDGDTSGQHIEGVLSFDRPDPAPKSVTLKIRGVGGIGERSYSWMLGQ